MIKRFLPLLILIFIITIFIFYEKFTTSNDRSLTRILAKGCLVVGIDDNSPPFVFRNPHTNNILGFDIDLLKKIADELQIKLVIKPINLNNIVNILYNEDIDMIATGFSITPERMKRIIFSRPYIKNKQLIISKNNFFKKNILELKDKFIGIKEGSSTEEIFVSKKIKKYVDMQLALTELNSGIINILIIDKLMYNFINSKNPTMFKVFYFKNDECGFGFRKQDVALQENINKILIQLKNNGIIHVYEKKWKI